MTHANKTSDEPRAGDANGAHRSTTNASSATTSTHAWSPLGDAFRRFAHHASNLVGSPGTFIAAALLIVVWAATGPFMGFSETWQLIINTGTTILTFLMVFLIQNTQNRDARAIHLKLDELIRGVKGARNRIIDLEDCTDEELKQLEDEFKRLRERDSRARKRHVEAKERHAEAKERQADAAERSAAVEEHRAAAKTTPEPRG
jgi:low affinity Fe/Cu permease